MIEPGDDLASIIYNNIIDNNIKIDDGDVIAVAQKVISKAEKLPFQNNLFDYQKGLIFYLHPS